MSEATSSVPEEHIVFTEDSNALVDILQRHGLDVSRWGEGPTKTVEALWDEVAQGETEIIAAGGELIRRTYVAAVDVFAQLENGERYRLREDKQVFKNGSERHRKLVTSLGEKIRPDETTDDAVRRAVKEELGIEKLIAFSDKGIQLLAKKSQTFGGMQTQLEMRMAEVEIAEEDFRPDGYIEHQAGKSVYFVWDKI